MKKNIVFLLFIVFTVFNLFNINNAKSQSHEGGISGEYIHGVVLDESPEKLKELLNKNIDVNEQYLCTTFLMTAVKSMARGKYFADYPEYAIEKVKMLINAGADINKYNCGNYVGSSPLTWAVTLPMQVQALEIDFNKSIDDNILSGQGDINIPGLVSKSYKEITKEEREKIRLYFHNSFKAVNKKLAPYYLEMIKLLVDSGSDVNAKGFEDATPLHHAAMIPQEITLEPLKYLLTKNVDINARDIHGNTPLFLAFSMKNNESVKLLIDAGADASIRNNDGVLYNQVVGELQRFGVDSNNVLKTETLSR